ncbi:hypothetical protein F2P56_021235 [Juglans regia]|uniref:Pentatricopeptide repeat-containing protein At5g46100-like n=2 Tax=Juglans regia TaxID=51240 RepID=A0A2I4HCT2_JUGRE|nr:pentatricopeptide repeat-containing protein At5g46100-like [Juglans regia]KAF5457104.1 hypothetical protein F2P56_021235 [Juglans regia]
MAGARLISRAFLQASNTTPSLHLTFGKRLLTFLHASPPFQSESFVPASARNSRISPPCYCFPSGELMLSSIHRHDRLFATEAGSNITKKEDEDGQNDEAKARGTKEIEPFDEMAVVEEPKDPNNLQEIFHHMRTKDGLLKHADKMFDALSEDGLTNEASELFAQIKEKGYIPSVVAYTAVIEAYTNAGQPKEALRVYLRMLASGIAPNAYTYSVLVKGLAADAKYLGDAKKYVMEMMSNGMRPNAGTYIAVFEALAGERKLGEAREFLEQMKNNGFQPDEKAVRKALNKQQGRAMWRGSFIDAFLFKTKKNRDLLVNRKIWSRRSIIWPEFVNCVVRIYNGKAFVRCKLTEQKVGHKFGEFALTRKRRPRTKLAQGKKSGKK